MHGGLGAVLVSSDGTCVSWFSLELDNTMCGVFAADTKDTIIYELEMLAACVAMAVWDKELQASYPIVVLDSDSVRHAFIRGVGLGLVAGTLMNLQLKRELSCNTSAWFARVPTEAKHHWACPMCLCGALCWSGGGGDVGGSCLVEVPLRLLLNFF